MAFTRAAKTNEITRERFESFRWRAKRLPCKCRRQVLCHQQYLPPSWRAAGQGVMDGNILTCPWHGWQYDVTTERLARIRVWGWIATPLKFVEKIFSWTQTRWL